MNGKIKLLIGVLAAALVIGGAYFAYQELGEKYKPDVFATDAAKTDAGKAEERDPGERDALDPGGRRAPDFTVFDANGNPAKLSDFFGEKPVVLNFWASWCSPCRAETPDLDKAYKKYGDDVNFVLVNMTDGYRETVKNAKDFVELHGFSFPVYFDSRGEAARAYVVQSIPKTFFIDKNGDLVSRVDSMIDLAGLEKGIETIK